MCGFAEQTFSGDYQDFSSRVHEEDRPQLESEIARCSALGESLGFDFRVVWPDGQVHWLDWRGDFVSDAQGQVSRIRGIALKSSAREALEAQTAVDRQRAAVAHTGDSERLSHLYEALIQISQAIVSIPTRQGLFEKVCQALVDPGGFRMVWIGGHDPKTDELVPLARVGDDENYLDAVTISVLDVPQGRGPAGAAFRENRPVICNDTLGSPATLPWRESMRRQGFRASACFPIRESGKVVGTLNVYADAVGGFQQREVALLVKAADDISFALDKLAQEIGRLQAEKQLRRERDFSDAVLESLPGVLYLYDQDGKFLRWNKNFEAITGYSAEEIQGMHPLDFFQAGEQRLLADKIEQVFHQGQTTVEAAFLFKDGRTRPYHFTGLKTRLDGIDCLVGWGIDISERRQAQDAVLASEARYRALFEYAPDGIVIADHESNYIDANPSICQMLGYSRQEMVCLGAADIVVFDEPRQIGAALDVIRSKADYHREWLFRRKDGSIFPAEVRATMMPDGNLLGMIRDITDRKETELALRELNETLETKVVERTEELRAALVRAEAADRVKSAFLATMSHELRTPLNSIIGFTGIILQGLAGPLTPEQTKQLGMVKSSSRHLLELINDVLDLSKIEAEQLEVRSDPFDLKASIERVVASVRPQVENKGLTLTANISADLGQMVSDRRRVEQILLNLISNAVKFTERGTVTVDAEIVEDNGSQLSLRVSDTGIGIKAEDLATLFRPFRQLDTGLSRQHEGTGLGLVICSRLATLLGGGISVTSQWSQGSQFTIVLPLRKELES
jgi:PAS domain S-box-containing protein